MPQQQQQQHKEKPTKLHLNPEALLVPQEDASADLPPKVPASTIVAKRVKLLQKKLVSVPIARAHTPDATDSLTAFPLHHPFVFNSNAFKATLTPPQL